jgi:cell division protease FtsH
MNNQQQRPGMPKPNNNPKKTPKFNLSWLYMAIFAALLFLNFRSPSGVKGGIERNISYSEFKEYVSKGYAEKVTAYDNNKAELTIIPDTAVRIFGKNAV